MSSKNKTPFIDFEEMVEIEELAESEGVELEEDPSNFDDLNNVVFDPDSDDPFNGVRITAYGTVREKGTTGSQPIKNKTSRQINPNIPAENKTIFSSRTIKELAEGMFYIIGFALILKFIVVPMFNYFGSHPEKEDTRINTLVAKTEKVSTYYSPRVPLKTEKYKASLKDKKTSYDFDNPLTWNWRWYENIKEKYGEQAIKKSLTIKTKKCGKDWISGTVGRAYINRKNNVVEIKDFGGINDVKALQKRFNVIFQNIQDKPLTIDGKWGKKTGTSLTFLKTYLRARYNISTESNKVNDTLDNKTRNLLNYFYCRGE